MLCVFLALDKGESCSLTRLTKILQVATGGGKFSGNTTVLPIWWSCGCRSQAIRGP